MDCFRTSLLKQTEDKQNLRSKFSRINNELSLYFTSIFSPGFHDYPGFPWPASTLMRLHVLQTASISKEYMPRKTYTVGNIQHIFSRVKFNTPGVIEPGFCSYSIHHRWWVILTVCLAALMNPSTPSQSAYYSYDSRKEKHMTSLKVIPMK